MAQNITDMDNYSLESYRKAIEFLSYISFIQTLTRKNKNKTYE
jgi:hypothetical protein